MKRIVLIACSLLLLLACRAPDAVSIPNEAPQATVPALTGEETVLPSPSPAPSAPVRSETTDAPSPSPAAKDLLLIENAGTSAVRSEPLPIAVKLRSFDWESANPEGDYETTYRDAQMDFAGLVLTLTELYADDTHTRLTVHVRHPEDWSLLESQNMNGWFLNFRVLLDGQQVPFALRAKSVQLGFDTCSERCDEYTVVLDSESVNMHTLAACQQLTLMPYVLQYGVKAEGFYWRSEADGDVVTTFTRAVGGLRPNLCDLAERAVTADLASACVGIEPQPMATREPVLRTVTVYDADVERNLREGYFMPDLKDGSNPPMWGVVRNETLDFSEMQIFIDRLAVTDLALQAIIRVHYPDSWPSRLKWMLSDGDKLNFHLYVDGEDYGKTVMQKNGVRMGMHMSVIPPYRVSKVEDVDNFVCDDVYYTIYANRTFAEKILQAKEICFVPIYRNDKVYKINGKTWDLDKEETPYGDIWKYDIIEHIKEPIYEIAAYFDPSALIVAKEVD